MEVAVRERTQALETAVSEMNEFLSAKVHELEELRLEQVGTIHAQELAIGGLRHQLGVTAAKSAEWRSEYLELTEKSTQAVMSSNLGQRFDPIELSVNQLRVRLDEIEARVRAIPFGSDE